MVAVATVEGVLRIPREWDRVARRSASRLLSRPFPLIAAGIHALHR